MGTPTDNEVRNLLDRTEVHDLFCRYSDALDLRKWELLDDFFTPDAMAYFPTGIEEQELKETAIQGREEIVSWLRNVFEDFGPTHHMISNLALSVDGDVGSTTCRVRAYHVAVIGDRRLFEESLARFSGTVRRTSQGWRFEEFRESIAIALGDPDELAAAIQERGLTS